MKVEYVYVLTNEAFDGNWVKIGFSDDVNRRCKELRSTGIPTKFEIEYWVAVRNAQHLERKVHKALAEYRINGDREFFSCGIDLAKDAIRNYLVHEATDESGGFFYSFDEFERGRSKIESRTDKLYSSGYHDGKNGQPPKLEWSQPYATGYADGKLGKHNKLLPRPCDLIPDCHRNSTIDHVGEGSTREGFEDRKGGLPPRYKYPSTNYCLGYNSTQSM